MNSKKYFSISLLLIFSCAGFSQRTQVTGRIIPGKSYPLELWVYNIESDSFVKDRQLNLTTEGEFSFNLPSQDNLYKLWLNGNELVFVNEGEKSIDIQIDIKSSSPFLIKGSKASNLMLDYLSAVSYLQNTLLIPLEPKMKKALKKDDKAAIREVEKVHERNLKLFVDSLDRQICSMGSSLAVFAIARTLDFNKYLIQIEKWYLTQLDEKPDSPFTRKFAELISNSKQLSIGFPSPEIALTGLDNKEIKLSELNGNGKIILLDFWASWCLPCRKENREFKELVKKYDARNFEIWSISIDKNLKAWKKALDKDEMPWRQSQTVNEDILAQFNVQSLPTNFLVDKDGIIRAKNIKAEELVKELSLLTK